MSPGNGSVSGLTTDELRAAVRAVLRDVLPAELTGPSRPTSVESVTAEVALGCDADLAAFVRRVAALCEDPVQRAALQDGRRQFRLAADPARLPAHRPGSMLRVERGAVTERTVKKAAADGVRLVVGPRAVLTPLARDKARALGVVIEKER